EQLVEELSAALRDGTLLRQLTPEQVWLFLDGQVRLLDMAPTPTTDSTAETELSDEQRALVFLREVMVLALDERVRTDRNGPRPVRALLPHHAQQICDRLLGATRPYTELEELRADLSATQDRPTHVTRTLRAAQLMLMIPLMVAPFLFLSAVPA